MQPLKHDPFINVSVDFLHALQLQNIKGAQPVPCHTTSSKLHHFLPVMCRHVSSICMVSSQAKQFLG